MPYSDPNAGRARARDKRRKATAAGQEISKRLKPVANSRRRNRALAGLRFFAESYFPDRFDKRWSDDQLRLIALIERAVLEGGRLAIALPRGSGKTTLTEVGAIWGALKGCRQFLVIIGADKTAAVEILDSIKTELGSNDLLQADFPREVGPFAFLEGEARRCNGQRFKGKRTCIVWRGDMIVFATLPGSRAAGVIVKVAGITGRLRGMRFTRPDGRVVRPDLVLADDPQTDDSARSDPQVDFRERMLTQAAGRLAGPGKRLAILCPLTVIRKNDLAERLFDPKRHPDWDVLRCKALYSFPTNLKLWEEYEKVFRDARERGGDGQEATEFYRRRRAEMDAGAKVAWPDNFEAPKELSGLQHWMNVFLFDRRTFFSEGQNEPEDDVIGPTGRITAEALLQKLNGRPRGEVPANCRWLVGHVDVHDEILYHTAVAVEPGFTPYTIDYGTWPGQAERYFQQSDPRQRLSALYPGRDKEGVIYAGLEELLIKHLMPRRYPRSGGGDAAFDLVLIDAGYLPALVANVIRAAGQGPRLMPSMGIPIGPAKKPFTEFKAEPGQILGRDWRKSVTKRSTLLTLQIDTNRWKSFTRDRILAPMGNAASWTIFGSDPREHQLHFDHLAAELPTPVSGPWGAMEQWSPKPGGPDNHWLDNLVAALCGACALPDGAKLAAWEKVRNRPRDGGRRREAVAYL